MNELTEEEVMHVAHLARIGVTKCDVEKYKIQLKQIMNEIDRINEVNIDSLDFSISPTINSNIYREDVSVDEKYDVLKNAPKTNGNYIEIKRFVND